MGSRGGEYIGAGSVRNYPLTEAVNGIGEGNVGAELSELHDHPGAGQDEVLQGGGVSGNVERCPGGEVVPHARIIECDGRLVVGECFHRVLHLGLICRDPQPPRCLALDDSPFGPRPLRRHV